MNAARKYIYSEPIPLGDEIGEIEYESCGERRIAGEDKRREEGEESSWGEKRRVEDPLTNRPDRPRKLSIPKSVKPISGIHRAGYSHLFTRDFVYRLSSPGRRNKSAKRLMESVCLIGYKSERLAGEKSVERVYCGPFR